MDATRAVNREVAEKEKCGLPVRVLKFWDS
jgi:hypothetical protein